MSKSIITIIICVISMLVSGVSIFITRKRINQISALQDVVMGEKERNNYVKDLTTKVYIMLGCLGLTTINIFLPDGLLKFLIPIISIVLVGFLMSTIMEEVDVFDVKKDDIDIYLERQNKRKETVKKQKELMEQEQKKKREERERNRK